MVSMGPSFLNGVGIGGRVALWLPTTKQLRKPLGNVNRLHCTVTRLVTAWDIGGWHDCGSYPVVFSRRGHLGAVCTSRIVRIASARYWYLRPPRSALCLCN